MQIPLLVLVLGVLIPVSGFIAWAGDRIGHQIGKRRHTLLGLRPRHTAMLFTVGSGVGISLVSFLVLWFASEGFRVVLSKGVQLLTINKSLRTENDRLLSEVNERTRQTSTARTDAQKALKDRDAALGARDSAISQSVSARVELTQARKGLSSAEQSLALAQKDYQATKGRLGITASRLGSARVNLEKAQTQLVIAQQRVTEAEKARVEAESIARTAREDVKASEKNRKDIEEKASRIISDTETYARQQKEIAQQAEQQSVALQSAVDKKQSELQQLQVGIESLQARRDELAKQLTASLSNAKALRSGQITYRVGEEVGRISIASDQSVWRIESALERFWASTAKKAEERGATASNTDGTRAVAISPRMAQTTGKPSGESGTVADASLTSEEDALRLLAQTIRRSEEPVAVILVASANAVVGEPVLVDVKTYRNHVVLPGGTRLGEAVINGGPNMTREQAADAVYEFLRRDVRKALLGAGVIPTASGEAEDGGSNVVSLTGSEWLKIMDDLKRSDFRARIIVKTAKTLRAADPVSLSFEVKELASVPLRSDFPNTGISPPTNLNRP